MLGTNRVIREWDRLNSAMKRVDLAGLPLESDLIKTLKVQKHDAKQTAL